MNKLVFWTTFNECTQECSTWSPILIAIMFSQKRERKARPCSICHSISYRECLL